MTRILVLYSIYQKSYRNTIQEHAFSFRRFAGGVKYFYLNVNFLDRLPKFIGKLDLDGVIFHYSLLAMRYARNEWPRFVRANASTLRKISGIKVAIPQDEYNFTEDLCKFIKAVGVKAVYTCASAHDFRTLYPEWVDVRDFYTVFTGYIDEKTLGEIANRKEEKKYDVGYRGRKLPYWLGRHAQLKTDIVTRTLPSLVDAGFVCNVEHTDKDSESRTFLGRSWIEFLSSCRTVLGCLGGASLMDRDGSIKERVDKYVSERPEATFEEVEAACFPGLDGNISLFALSPRHFECAMAKTCQILIEGDYQGVFIPGKHFIELKKDFSNMSSVIELIRNKEYCERIAAQCFQDVVMSGNYTYGGFANRIIEYITSQKNGMKKTSTKQWYLRKLLALTALLMRPAALRLSCQFLWREYRKRGFWWQARMILVDNLGPAVPLLRKVKRMFLGTNKKDF